MSKESPDLVRADEARKMEMKKLTGEEYQKQYDNIADGLKRNQRSFETVINMDRRIASLKESALKNLTEAIKKGDKEVMDQTVEDLEKAVKDLEEAKGLHGDYVRAMRQQIHEFVDYYRLEKSTTITEEMGIDEIQEAIDNGFAAKMWKMTNRIEE